MKKILVTGANSYIGTSVEKWLKKYPDQYQAETLDLLDPKWHDFDFSSFDVVFHVAGIAHIKETAGNAHLYYEINRDLVFEVAQKSKEAGISQFIFLSSMSVYGVKTGIITKDTAPTPKSNYGKSKLQAEEKISTLRDNNFRLAILRPPMIYGPNCKGNFPRLVKYSRLLPIFPQYSNQRSMLFIDNLSEVIRLRIDDQEEGIFFPQNKEYVNSSELVKEIIKYEQKKIFFTSIFNIFIPIAIHLIKPIRKLFGSLIYDHSLSNYRDWQYCIVDFKTSICKTMEK